MNYDIIICQNNIHKKPIKITTTSIRNHSLNSSHYKQLTAQPKMMAWSLLDMRQSLIGASIVRFVEKTTQFKQWSVPVRARAELSFLFTEGDALQHLKELHLAHTEYRVQLWTLQHTLSENIKMCQKISPMGERFLLHEFRVWSKF